MTVEETSNRLIQEMQKSLPHWEMKFGEFASLDAKLNIIGDRLKNDDVEVGQAFKDLIQAIMEEQE